MQKAFTLIELVVVLTIMAVLAHLAMREVSAFREEKLYQSSNRQLAEIQAATAAYVSDMGELPKKLEDLWKRPAGAKKTTIVDACTVNVDIPTNRVAIAAGWKGPYLKLPIGKTNLYDAYGNDFLVYAPGDEGILAVGHCGMDGVEGVGVQEESPYARDVWVRFDDDNDRESLNEFRWRVKLDPTEYEGGVVPNVDIRVYASGPTGIVKVATERVGDLEIEAWTRPGEKVLWESVTRRAHRLRARPEAPLEEIKLRQ